MTPEIKTAIKITKYTNKLLQKRFFRFKHQEMNLKKHAEIVTASDLESNNYITKTLLKKFPNYDIVSEEAPKIDNPDTKTWYIDPVDGTTNFAYGFTEYGTCIGLTDQEKILGGIIGLPNENEIYWAEKNSGAWCGKNKLKVSDQGNLEQSMLLLCPGHSPEGKERFAQYFAKINLIKIHFRLIAAACVELTAIASGRADACILSDIHPWDVVAGVAIIREAGGKVTNFQGEEWNINHNTLIATNGSIHEEILNLVRDIN